METGRNSRILVVGGGSWATALIKILSQNVNSISWWMRDESAIEHLKLHSHNPKYLQSTEFDMENITISSDLNTLIDGAEIIIIAVPSAFVHATFKKITGEALHGKFIFSALKGMIPEMNVIPARYLHKNFGIPYSKIGIICGPCHAEEA